ncbi:MAG: DUF3034 family protein [Saccharospirillaceae bacterium]|nr:DUF3034 family protein [Saccharospirillaceae bacterium]MCD8531008.1 DUF3034 family protein [Saccharospirillaceae bacterium]
MMRLKQQGLASLTVGLLSVIAGSPVQAEGRLLATSGVTQLEGAAGGGLVPWALISGYSEQGERSVSAFTTRTDVQDFRLDVLGGSWSYDNRLELSAAQQSFRLKNTATDIRQEIYGAKIKLAGDAVFTALPQVALGVQYKRLLDGDTAAAVGADNHNQGTDVYLSASSIHLAALAGYNLLWNATVRASKANQMGLLGFGGDNNRHYQLLPEVSALVLLRDGLALGAEYRTKPDNLTAFREDDYRDVFIAWFPHKHLNLTLAWAQLGSIAGSDDQDGLYLSLTGYFQ